MFVIAVGLSSIYICVVCVVFVGCCCGRRAMGAACALSSGGWVGVAVFVDVGELFVLVVDSVSVVLIFFVVGVVVFVVLILMLLLLMLISPLLVVVGILVVV